MDFNTTKVLFKHYFSHPALHNDNHFNTTKVLFKRSTTYTTLAVTMYFNTTKVLFKLRIQALGAASIANFNTTKVLFKHDYNSACSSGHQAFQYYKSTLQTPPPSVCDTQLSVKFQYYKSTLQTLLLAHLKHQ